MVTFETPPALLRELRAKPSATSHHILIATDVGVMRGFDYLGGHKGLCLIIDKGFASQSAADQALARVGRGGEMCERYITVGTKLIDEKLNQAVIKKLIMFEKKFSASIEAERVPKIKKPTEL